MSKRTELLAITLAQVNTLFDLLKVVGLEYHGASLWWLQGRLEGCLLTELQGWIL
jgi:hypothetical protein